jgi:hypothetical protein
VAVVDLPGKVRDPVDRCVAAQDLAHCFLQDLVSSRGYAGDGWLHLDVSIIELTCGNVASVIPVYLPDWQSTIGMH